MADCQSAFVIVGGRPVTIAAHPVQTVTGVYVNGPVGPCSPAFDGPYVCEREHGHEGECDARIYPCDFCGKLRTRAQGGTVFCACDECWDKLP